MTDIDFNALGQAIDSTWGRSSTPRTASYSVKISLLGPDRMLVSYAAIVSFSTERQMIEMKRAYSGEADSVIAEVIKTVKKNYKELSGSALSTKAVTQRMDGEGDSIEIINFNCHNARRQAYYRRKAVYELG